MINSREACRHGIERTTGQITLVPVSNLKRRRNPHSTPLDCRIRLSARTQSLYRQEYFKIRNGLQFTTEQTLLTIVAVAEIIVTVVLWKWNYIGRTDDGTRK